MLKTYKEDFESINVTDYDKWLSSVTFLDFNYKNSCCTCLYWTKNFFCKHKIALAWRDKGLEWHKNAKDVSLGENRKRGRPADSKINPKRL